MKTINNKNDNKYIYLCIFVFLITIYFFTSSENYFFHADASYLRYDVAESIVERFDLTVTESFGVKGADGRDYSWIGLGSALVSVPFYIVGNLVGAPKLLVAFVNPVFTALTAVLLFIFVNELGYTRRASIIATMCFGLGTIAWPLSKQPFDHPIETFFILLSFFHCYLFVNNKRSENIMFSGAAAGMAFLTRPTTILLLPSLIALTLHSHHRKAANEKAESQLLQTAIQFQTAFLPFAGISLWYNNYRFGSIFETGYSLIASRLGLDFFSGTSLLSGLSGFLISPGKGFFFYSPITVLFFFSIKPFYKSHKSLFISFSLFISSYLVFLAKNVYWHGDWTWGPRYLLAITPFLIIPISVFVNSLPLKNIAIKVSFYLILLVSILIQVSAVMVDYTKYFNDLYHGEKVEFIVSTGEGVQTIIEPPNEIYFNLNKSPILAQFKYIKQLGENLNKYRDKVVKDNPLISDQLKTRPGLYFYDFWWVYLLIIDGIYSTVLVILALALVITYSGWKLYYAAE